MSPKEHRGRKETVQRDNGTVKQFLNLNLLQLFNIIQQWKELLSYRPGGHVEIIV